MSSGHANAAEHDRWLIIRAGDVELNPGPLSILQWNCQGLRAKKEELTKFAVEAKIDVIAVQEANFPKQGTVRINGFADPIIGRRKVGRTANGPIKGGDVAIFIRNGINHQVILAPPIDASDSTTEWAGATIFADNNTSSIDLHNLYVPPIRTGRNDERVNNFNIDLLPSGPNNIIVGDVNYHHPSWDDNCDEPDDGGTSIDDWTTHHNVQIINSGEATHLHQGTGNLSTPDIAIVSNNIAPFTDWSVADDLGSDHKPIKININFGINQQSRPRTRWSFKKAKWGLFKDMVERSLTDTPIIDDTVVAMTKDFNNIILEAARKNIPRGARKNPLPWWNDEVDRAVKARKDARKQAQTNEDLNEVWIEAARNAREVTQKAKEDQWHKFVSTELSDRTNPTKVWNIIKSMDGRAPKPPPNTPLHVTSDNNTRILVTDKEKANAFIQEYADMSRLPRNAGLDTPIKVEVNRAKRLPCSHCNDTHNGMCANFTSEELSKVLRDFPTGKAEGPDRIPAEMLKALGTKGFETMLRIVNKSWTTNTTPNSWRDAIIIPIPKTGKPTSDIKSYRPISLTCHFAKITERLIKNRLYWWLENNQILQQEQAGFRACRSTEDHIARIIQGTTDAWSKQKPGERTIITLFDFARAYDKVWRRALIAKMFRLNIPKCIILWIREFLSDRTAKVRLNDTLSKVRNFRQGLPQGSVLAPILFTIWIQDLQAVIPPTSEAFVFADDLMLATRNTSITTAEEHMQTATTAVSDWADQWKMQLAPEKCESMILTQWAKEANHQLDIRIKDHTLRTVNCTTFLGVTLDRLLHFGNHVTKIKKKANARIRQLSALAGRSWGAKTNILRSVYTTYIRSCIDYAAGAWLPSTSPSHVSKLETIQNKAARIITGCPLKSNVDDLLEEARLEPLRVRGRIRGATLYEKALRKHPDDPLYKIAMARSKQRLKNIQPSWRELGREAAARSNISNMPREQIHPIPNVPPWEEVMHRITTYTQTDPPVSKKDQPAIQKQKAETYINSLEPVDITIWTDGSVRDSTQNGGGGYVINGPTNITGGVAAGIICSSFRAEISAMNAALQEVRKLEREPNTVRIFTDSQAAVQHLSCGPSRRDNKATREFWDAIKRSHYSVHLHWIPSHCGIEGNEFADQEAEKAATLDQQHIPIGLDVVGHQFKRDLISDWRHSPTFGSEWRKLLNITNNVAKDTEERLTREEAVTLHQIRVGKLTHTKKFLFSIGKADSPTCIACDSAEESTDHLLFECPAHDQLRWKHLGPPPYNRQQIIDNPTTLLVFLEEAGRLAGT